MPVVLVVFFVDSAYPP